MRLTRAEAGVVLAALRRAYESILSPDESEILPEQVAVAALHAVGELISHALADRAAVETADELVPVMVLAVDRDLAELDDELEDVQKARLRTVLRKLQENPA